MLMGIGDRFSQVDIHGPAPLYHLSGATAVVIKTRDATFIIANTEPSSSWTAVLFLQFSAEQVRGTDKKMPA
jgi:hypothetical protein